MARKKTTTKKRKAPKTAVRKKAPKAKAARRSTLKAAGK
jgi:hypothetical protein